MWQMSEESDFRRFGAQRDSGLDRKPMKILRKRLHMIAFACLENQFRCRVLDFLSFTVQVKWAAS